MTPSEKITEYAKALSNADPEIYAKLAAALDRYVFDVTVAVTEAATDEVLRAQGQAQMARKFMNLFTEFLA